MQAKYTMPFLSGAGIALSRLGGGIGTRGPGEKKIEVDRRKIRRRIFELEEEIKRISIQYDTRRAQREKNNIPSIALVGYTNAGKSSLLNAICGSDVKAEDKLFATLDLTTRRAKLPLGKEVVFTDTVGFIENLPHELVESFNSTLKEALHSDILLMVTDASSEHAFMHNEVVRNVLDSLGAHDKKMICVYNKCDLLDEIPENSEVLFISALNQTGIELLLNKIDKMLEPIYIFTEICIKYDKGDVLAIINEKGKDVNIEYDVDKIKIKCLLPEDIKNKLIL